MIAVFAELARFGNDFVHAAPMLGALAVVIYPMGLWAGKGPRR